MLRLPYGVSCLSVGRFCSGAEAQKERASKCVQSNTGSDATLSEVGANDAVQNGRLSVCSTFASCGRRRWPKSDRDWPLAMRGSQLQIDVNWRVKGGLARRLIDLDLSIFSRARRRTDLRKSLRCIPAILRTDQLPSSRHCARADGARNGRVMSGAAGTTAWVERAGRAGGCGRRSERVQHARRHYHYMRNAATLHRCSPSLSMPRRISSPTCSHLGSFMPSATPGGVPVVTTSPASSTMKRVR